MHAAERFWRKVKISGPNDCWPWLSYRQTRGYGRFGYRGRNTKAHRIALFGFGPLLYESELQACHTCDVPSCCNPRHLFIATQAGNNLDSSQKGRSYAALGEAHGNAKLSEEDVRTIKIVLAQGTGTPKEIAKYFGVSRRHISDIKTGRRWPHVGV
jgi:hypothetical protein